MLPCSTASRAVDGRTGVVRFEGIHGPAHPVASRNPIARAEKPEPPAMTPRARFSHRPSFFSASAPLARLSSVALMASVACTAACGDGAGAKSAESTRTATPIGAAPRGYAVLARPPFRDAAWSLAQDTYRSERLRPRLDEGTARVLAGEAAPSGRRDLTDLAETRDAITDEGVPSRKLLASLAKDLGLEGILVVTQVTREGESPAAPVARVFEADAGSFSPIEVRSGEGRWLGAVASIERLAPPMAREQASSKPVRAPSPDAAHAQEGKSKAFYESPWFWGAAGAAIALGGAFFLATRDSASDSIHVQMQVPR